MTNSTQSNPSRRYISTKIVLIIAIIVYMAINTAAQYYSSNDALTEHFTNEKEAQRQQYIRILNALYDNWTYGIESLANAITNTEIMQNAIQYDTAAIQSILEQHAASLSYEKGLQSIAILDDRDILSAWNQEINNLDLSHQPEKLFSPFHKTVCDPVCINYSFIPFNSKVRNKATIVLLVDAADLMLEFYRVTQKILKIQLSSDKVVYKNRQYLNDVNPSLDNILFYVEDDVQIEKGIASELRNNIILIAAFTTVVLLALLLFILVPPLKRLERLTNGLPLLATNQFTAFRQKIGHRKSSNFLDIDELHDKSLEISFQLEAFFNTLSVNTEIASNMPGALFQFEVLPFNKYNLKYISDGIHGITGYASEELIGNFNRILEIIHRDDLDGFVSSIELATAYEQRWFYEFRLYDKFGIIHWLRGSSIPKKESNDVTIWNGVILDITTLKEAENKAHEAIIEKKIAQESTKEKDKFLSNISHEIRTPLNTIVGLSFLLGSEDVSNEKQRDYLRNINSASQFLLTLINNILEQSTLDAGKIVLNNNNVEIGEILQNVVKIVEPLADQKQNVLKLVSDVDLSLIVNTDETRIKQILLNLLGNAVKHTKCGLITLSVETLIKSQQTIKLRISVKDTGQGIAEADQEAIFDRFHTIGSQETGTGLGLAITKEIVNLLNGTIGVKSLLGIGTEFWVDLELFLPKAINTPNEGVSQLSHANILLVDDDQFNLYTTKEILKYYGYDVDSVNNSIVMQSILTTKSYDILILDYHMPNVDNNHIIDWIKQNHKQLPIIIYSADTTLRKKNLPVEEVLIKPAPAETLRKVIERHLRKNPDSSNNDSDVIPIHKNLWQLVGGVEEFQQLCDVYEQQISELITDLHNVKMEKNYKLLKPIIHRLKSNAGIIGDNSLLRIVNSLDDAIKEQDDVKVNELIPRLQKEMQQSLIRLRESVPQLMEEQSS